MIVLRRLDVAPFILFAIWLLGLAVVILLTWPQPTGGWLVLSAATYFVMATCYLSGPAPYVQVRSDCLTVANTFRRFEIPRHRIKKVGGYRDLGVAVYLDDGSKVDIGAFERAFGSHWSYGGYRRRGFALEKALEEVPPTPSHADVRRRIRYFNVLVAVILGVLASVPVAMAAFD